MTRKPRHLPYSTSPVARTASGRVLALCRPEHEAGVNLTSVPGVAPACLVFTAAELDARLDYYAARAALSRPLFADGPPELPDDGAVRCMGCDAPCPSGKRVDCCGWVSRPLLGYGVHAEVWCPGCWTELGEDSDDAEA